MNESDALLARVVEQARTLGTPASTRISPRVTANCRATIRSSCCIQWNGGYVIKPSEWLLEAKERVCMQALAHEVLHAYPGCRNHGTLWKRHTTRTNGAYGYATPCTGTCGVLGAAGTRPVRYWLMHERCKQEFCRSRRPPLVDYPE